MRKIKSLKDLKAKGSRESLIVSLNGSAKVTEDSKKQYELGPIDACYIPPKKSLSFEKTGNSSIVELIWATAPARGKFRSYLRRFEDRPHKEFGSVESSSHRFNTTIITFDKKEKSERLRAGYTEADRGSWTSFPPHRHDGVPEVYIFTKMQKGFGLQMSWNEKGEDVYLVREGDAVGFNSGYHPNVGDPTTRLRFLWVMSSDLTTTSKIHPDFVNVKE